MAPGRQDPTTTLQLEGPEAGPLIPPELLWLYPLGPLLAAPLLFPDLTQRTGWELASDVATLAVDFGTQSAAFHLLLTGPLGAWVLRRTKGAARWAVLAVITVGVASTIAMLTKPVHDQLCRTAVPLLHQCVISTLFASLFVFPSVAFQAARRRALRAERLAEAERRSRLEAQLAALQARTHPHFLFNTLNTVASLIPDDPVLAERTLERLAELFRYALDASKTPWVPLARELEVVRDYLEVQRARFGSRLEVEFQVEPGLEAVRVPPLLVQPLVENAVLHGLHDRSRGRVTLTVRREGETVRVSVGDDGPGPGRSDHQGARTSVAELRERLSMLFGERARFELADAPGGGCLAQLTFPAEVLP